MNDDNLALKIFNRLNNYLKKNCVYDMFKIENEIIYFYSYHFNKWFKWYNHTDISLDKACEWFLLGNSEKVQTKTGCVIKYESFFESRSHSQNPIVKRICNYIGKPSCLEELVIKMDLMGI